MPAFLRDRSVVQSQMAQAQAILGAARAYLYQTLEGRLGASSAGSHDRHAG
jgi:hypothetical protein